MVSQVNGTTHVKYVVPNESTGTRRVYVQTRRAEDLDEDTLEISSKKNDKEEKGFIAKTVDTLGNAASKFVDITVNAFTRAAADVVVDKAVGKITGK